MSLSNIEKGIVIIGAGNVATHLSIALKESGFLIKSVYSRILSNAKELALIVGSSYTDDINKIPEDAGLYIIAVKDEAIEKIVRLIKLQSANIVHTAGSISIDVFKGHFTNYGVFYPLQTFTKSRSLDFANIPVCIEASNDELEKELISLAKSLTNSVHVIDSPKRELLHLSAVFACNFTNHMYSIATEILKRSGLGFELLKPLILETAFKAADSDPVKAQTGPAARNDQNIMEKHMDMLKDKAEFKKIYSFASESILKLKQETDTK